MLIWAPRILSILFAMFLALLAVDVFDEGSGFWEAIVALLIHLVPVYIFIGVLYIAWRRALVGAISFNAFALFYLVYTRGQEHWGAYLVISGPLVLLGVLFLFSWIHREQLRT
jgi:hypothetical protein